MKKEQYVPSPEETKKAEENLTESEQFTSKKRERSFNFLEEHYPELLEKLRNGEYNLELDGYKEDKLQASDLKSRRGAGWNPSGQWARLHGSIGSNEIDIKIKTARYPYDGSIEGKIDGKKISSEVASKLFDKYKWVVEHTDNSIHKEQATERERRMAKDKEEATPEYKLKEQQEKETLKKNAVKNAEEEKLAQQKVDDEKEKYKDIL